jgi:hypothetical protein
MARIFLTETVAGKAAQFLIDERREPFSRFLLPLTQLSDHQRQL